jgi:hypothetical protein
MKKSILISSIILFFSASTHCLAGGDSTKTAIPDQLRIYNEIGFDATSLLKQVLSLSNAAYNPLPYDLTYDLIKGSSAIRFGAGMLVQNYGQNSTSVTTYSPASGTSIPAGPDPQIPFVSNETNIYYRVGWERRFNFGSRITAYCGIDFVGQSYYYYTKNNETDKYMAYGGGPVAGIQIHLTKRLSLFTELPVYFMASKETDVTTSYNNQLLNGYTNTFSSMTSKQTATTTGTNFTVNLPVTVYVAFKF